MGPTTPPDLIALAHAAVGGDPLAFSALADAAEESGDEDAFWSDLADALELGAR